MQYGILPPGDATFRSVALLMANHERYASMPLQRLKQLRKVIEQGHVWGATEGGELRGAVPWREFPRQAVVDAIAARKLPHPKLQAPSGEALVVLGFIAHSPADVRPLVDSFREHHKGKIIVVKRMFQEGRETRYMWVDRDGRHNGPNL